MERLGYMIRFKISTPKGMEYLHRMYGLGTNLYFPDCYREYRHDVINVIKSIHPMFEVEEVDK